LSVPIRALTSPISLIADSMTTVLTSAEKSISMGPHSMSLESNFVLATPCGPAVLEATSLPSIAVFQLLKTTLALALPVRYSQELPQHRSLVSSGLLVDFKNLQPIVSFK